MSKVGKEAQKLATGLRAVKVIALDIDGTLLPYGQLSNRQYTDRVLAGLGAMPFPPMVTIATGRSLYGAHRVAEDLLLPISREMVLNGGRVVMSRDPKGPVVMAQLPVDIAGQIIDVAINSGAHTIVYENQTESTSKDIRIVSHRALGWSAKRDRPSKDFNQMVIDWQKGTLAPSTPISAVLVEPGQTEELPELLRKLEAIPRCKVRIIDNRFIELVDDRYSKERALEELATKWGITPGEVMTIGDSDVDAGMLQWAGVGIASRDASPAAQKAADFISPHGPGDVVVNAIKLLTRAQLETSHRTPLESNQEDTLELCAS